MIQHQEDLKKLQDKKEELETQRSKLQAQEGSNSIVPALCQKLETLQSEAKQHLEIEEVANLATDLKKVHESCLKRASTFKGRRLKAIETLTKNIVEHDQKIAKLQGLVEKQKTASSSYRNQSRYQSGFDAYEQHLLAKLVQELQKL